MAPLIMSSREIADLLEKEHRDVLISMDSLEKRNIIQCFTSMTQNPKGAVSPPWTGRTPHYVQQGNR